MQQHAVPQNVTQYQFRLVGDMTLKQFLELAGGLVLAYLFYASNLIGIIKMPLAIMSVLLGAALAFFPIEERPLDQWITNFVKAIYQPTRFIWKKTFRLPSLFLFTSTPREVIATAVKTVKAPTLNRPTPVKSDLSADESSRLAVLDSLFGSSTPPTSGVAMPTQVPVQVITEKPTVKVRKLNPVDSLNTTLIFDANKSKPAPKIETTNYNPPQDKHESRPVFIPQTQNVFMADKQTVRQSDQPISGLADSPITTPTVHSQPKPTLPLAAPKTINLPAPPKQENIVVGMVVDVAGKMVENAIVQIVNKSGIPARAIKTNSLGQFYTSTPLGEGDYAIEVEKDGLTFNPVGLAVKNKLIPPLLIRSN